jgi:Protein CHLORORESPIRATORY REDUCTION 7
MSDPLIRERDHYVVLEPGRGEQLLSEAETRSWLAERITELAELPPDLADLPDGFSRACRLLDTACELELAPGVTVQWFAIRLEPPQR